MTFGYNTGENLFESTRSDQIFPSIDQSNHSSARRGGTRKRLYPGIQTIMYTSSYVAETFRFRRCAHDERVGAGVKARIIRPRDEAGQNPIVVEEY